VERANSLGARCPKLRGVLHSTGSGPDVRAGVKMAFAEIETQVKKHLARLRKHYEWSRRRPRAREVA